ncbi:MAG: nitrilase family protein [Paludibacteraceae bacterium]|nr:nitrilase family protein [Paludibacteraceae bacterium]
MEPATLTISIVQADVYWEDTPRNLAHFDTLLQQVPAEANCVVLPEMFSTAFSANARALAEPMDGSTLTWVRKWAKTLNALIAGSFIVCEKGKYYNRGFAILPDGREYFYDKHHLFIGGEKASFEQGGKRPQFEYLGWQISMVICYDLRFPVFMRNTKKNPYDLMLVVAEWPKNRQYILDHLAVARAIENQAYLCMCNRIGEDGNMLTYSGCSCLIDFKGKVKVRCTDDTEEICTYSIDKYPLESHREKAPVWRDADDFELDL